MKSAYGIICAVFAVAAVSSTARAATITVNPGESIQDAVDAAQPGDTVKVMPGDYTETHGGTAAVRITKPLKLVAKSKLTASPPVKVRILPGPGNQHGILVEPPSPGVGPDVDGVMIKGFTVEGFSNNGIWLRYVQNFKIKGNESIDNLENGIWPTLSANGLVKKNLSYGSQDAALWIEASENVRAIKNELHSSPTGFEITVSKNIKAVKNDIHDNTVGVGLYHPNAASLDPLGGDGDWFFTNNHIYNNNRPNSAPPGSMSAALPPGIGVLVLGVDRTVIKKNLIENNDFVGIGVLNYCIAVEGTDFDCDLSPPIVEPAPDDNEFINNQILNNGNDPPVHPFAIVADNVILVAAGGVNNCFSGNTTSNNQSLPECP